MSRRFRPRQVQPKRRRRGLRPLLGFFLAIALGVIAYVAAPYLVDFAESQSASVAGRFAQFRVEFGQNTPEYVMAFLLWIAMLAIVAFVAAANVGEDPEKEAFKYMGPSPADRDAQVKLLRRELKKAKQREKQHKSS